MQNQAQADKSATLPRRKWQQSTGKHACMQKYTCIIKIYTICFFVSALINKGLPTNPLKRSNSVVHRRNPTSTSDMQANVGVTSELQKKLERRRHWEQEPDLQLQEHNTDLCNRTERQQEVTDLIKDKYRKTEEEERRRVEEDIVFNQV